MNTRFIVILACVLQSCTGNEPATEKKAEEKEQTTAAVDDACDGCELMYEGMPQEMNAIDTSAGWNEAGTKLVISGTVFKNDDSGPAADVIVYYWQTDNTGRYTPAENMNEKAKQHGHIRGWMKTDQNGNYTLYTVRPAPYPAQDLPAHIHLVIKEPGDFKEYYIDDIVFSDDDLLTIEKRSQWKNRGGSGMVVPELQNGILQAHHSIFLGMNIPGYPH